MNTSDYTSKELNHLGLVAGMCDELKIVESIDNLIAQDLEKSKISIGEGVKAMIMIGLGFTQRRLYLASNFFDDKPISHLFGKSIDASHFNDDKLGRILDKIYQYGSTSIFSNLASNACKILGLNSKFGHLDSTSFHVDGKYNSQDENVQTIKITKGYSRDHRPELNQIILNMIVENKSGIPVLMQASSGNSSDKTDFSKIIKSHTKQLKNAHGFEYQVADSALYTQANLKKISDISKWISRVPETLKSSKLLIQNSEVSQMEKLKNGYYIKEIGSYYADIKQRWLLVFSEKAFNREIKTLDKNMLDKSQNEIKKFNKLCCKNFACEEDAIKALNDFKKDLKIINISSFKIMSTVRYDKKGRPKQNAKPSKILFNIDGEISISLAKRDELKRNKGFFILATNELSEEKLSDEDILLAYKNQGRVERGFRFLKDPQFMASTVFLKKPERIEALLMIMTLCLMIYSALEYRIRTSLAKLNKNFPDQKGKSTQKPTTKWVFYSFKGIHLLVIKKLKQQIILNLKEKHNTIIDLLGARYKKYYLMEF